MTEATRACSNRRRALIGSWVTPPTTGAIEIERGGDEKKQSTTAAGKGKQGDRRHDDGNGRHNDSKGRHGNGKRQQGNLSTVFEI